MANYLVVLFKDKKKKRIINKFITPSKAQDFFKKKMSESDEVIFDVRFENGKEVFYEMGVIHMSSKQETPVAILPQFQRKEPDYPRKQESADDYIARIRAEAAMWANGQGR